VLPYHPETPPNYDVPGLGPEEDDTQFAVFNEPECRRLGELTARLSASGARFKVPKIWADEPETVAVWDGHVRDRLVEFAQLRDLELPNLHLITFIG
jgi:hypothetical protein